MSLEIDSKLNSVEQVLLDGAYVYLIPDFQRAFVWDDGNVRQLFEDFSEDTNAYTDNITTLDGYLLGNIVLIDKVDAKERVVVDGQQRLTTLSLISRALYDVINNGIDSGKLSNVKVWYQRIGNLENAYCIKDYSDNYVGPRIKHDADLLFGDVYSKVIQGQNISKKDYKTSADKNIKKIYDKAYSIISKFTEDELSAFTTYFKGKVKLIVTVAPNEEKAFQLFDVLNNRGRDLEPLDLVKNMFLKIIKKEVGQNTPEYETFKDEWLQFNSILDPGSSSKKIKNTSFLKQFILYYYGDNVKAANTYSYFKDKAQNMVTADVLKIANELHVKSEFYKEIITGDYSNYSTSPKMKYLYEILGITQFTALLMKMSKESLAKREEILDLSARLASAVIFSNKQTNYIESLLPDIMKRYITTGSYSDFVSDLKSEIDGLIPTASGLINNRTYFVKGKIDNDAVVIYQLIELYKYGNTSVVDKKVMKKDVTYDLLLSDTLNMAKLGLSCQDLGYSSNVEQSTDLYRIGNICLVSELDSKAISSSTLDDKLRAYKTSNFKSTKDVDTYNVNSLTFKGNCTKSLIEKRSNDIAKQVCDILQGK